MFDFIIRNFLSWKENKHFDTGLIRDPRSIDEQAGDYLHEEVAMGSTLQWEEKEPKKWKKFSERDQDGSLACVGATGAKLLEVDNFKETQERVKFSFRDIYDRRSNKPDGGMWLQEMLKIISDYGSATEELIPSDNLSEGQMNKPLVRSELALKTARLFRAGGYVSFEDLTIDKVASVVATSKAVAMVFTFNYDEWTDVPLARTWTTPSIRHAVAAVDYCLWKGEKALVIEDSWGRFKEWPGQRVITESFFKRRCYGAGYALDLSNEYKPGMLPAKPQHTFEFDLSFGFSGNDVVKLQDILKYEQLFPQNVPSTGRYYQITARGVLEFQRRHAIASAKEIESLQGNVVGPKTRAVLNQLYG